MDQKPRHGLHLFGKQPFSELEPCRRAWYRSIRLSHGKSCGTCLQRGIYLDTPYPMNLCLWAALTSCGIAENDQRSLDLSSQHMASILKKNAAMFVLYHQLIHLGAIDCSYELSSHNDTDAIYFLGVSMLNLRFLTRMANLHKSLVTWQDDVFSVFNGPTWLRSKLSLSPVFQMPRMFLFAFTTRYNARGSYFKMVVSRNGSKRCFLV